MIEGLREVRQAGSKAVEPRHSNVEHTLARRWRLHGRTGAGQSIGALIVGKSVLIGGH